MSSRAGFRPMFGAPSFMPPKPAPIEDRGTPTAAAGMSTGAKVATGVGVTIGGVAVTTLIIAAATGWGISRTLDKGWEKLKSVF